MSILGGQASGMGRILVLTLVIVGWLLIGSPVHAELAANQAVFTDHSGTKCGVIGLSDGTLSLVGEFDCVTYSEGVDVTSDGRWAVIGNSATTAAKLWLVDLQDPKQPVVQDTIVDTGLQSIEELDIAPDDSFGIAVRAGLHCAPYTHRRIGTYPDGAVRISPGPFNTDDQVTTLLDALEQIAG